MTGSSWQVPLFLVWPLGALAACGLRYPKALFKTTIILFCCFYGLTMVIPNEGNDANRYIEDFNTVRQQNFSDVYKVITRVFTPGAELADPANWLICYVVSRFTSEPRWLFATFGIIFGFFYAHNLDFLLRHARPKLNKLAWLFLIGFALLIPVSLINGYRMWTAAHIFFFAAVRVLMERRYCYLAVAAASVLLHFSFAAPTVLLSGFCLAGRRDMIYLLVATASLFAGNIAVSELPAYAHYLGPVVEERAGIYTNEDYKREVADTLAGVRWFMWSGRILMYADYAALVYVFLRYRRQLAPELARLFSFCLLFLAFVALVLPIPSMARFAEVWNLFVVAFLFFVFQQAKLKHLPVLGWTLLPPLALAALVQLRIGMETTGMDLIVSNFVLVWFSPHEMSLYNLLF